MDNFNKILETLKITNFKVVGNKLILGDPVTRIEGLDRINKSIVANCSFNFLLPNLVFVKGYLNATLRKDMKLGILTCERATIHADGSTLEATKLNIEELGLSNVNLKNTEVVGSHFLPCSRTRIINCKISYLYVDLLAAELQNVIFYNCGVVDIDGEEPLAQRGTIEVRDSKRVIASLANNIDFELKNVKNLVLGINPYYSNLESKQTYNKFIGSVDSVLIYGLTDIDDINSSSEVKGYLHNTIRDLKYKDIKVIDLEEFLSLQNRRKV